MLLGVLRKLRHLNHGLGVILGFIGLKLLLHWAHGIWPAIPQIPTLVSLAIIIVVLTTVTITSVRTNRRDARRDVHHATAPPSDG